MKLLHKTLKLYLIFSVIVFIISVPVFYYLIQDLWIKDVDDSLIYQKENIIEGLNAYAFDSAKMFDFTENAERFDMGVYVFPIETFHSQADSLYDNAYFDSTRQHVEPFRELTSFICVNGKSYKVIVRKDLVESADLIRGISFTQAILFLILLAGILILNSYFSRKIWQPFYTIVSKLKSFRIDKQEPIAAQKTEIIEFNELGEAIQRLTENNIRTFKSQKEFTENAAHETQTPLAVIKNQIDLMVQDNNLTLQQSEIITRIDKNFRLLTKLNRNLLFLAKIENEQYNKTDDADISAIIIEICSAFEEEMKLKGIKILTTINAQPVILSNTYLLHSLVTNLLTNAIKYNIPDGQIEVMLTEKLLTILNTGVSQPLPEDKIYQRFYKKSEKSDSSGLGLAIVKKICDSLNFSIQYHFSEPNEHSFSIGFC
jgi:signal transduction histidine kinase